MSSVQQAISGNKYDNKHWLTILQLNSERTQFLYEAKISAGKMHNLTDAMNQVQCCSFV